MLRKSLRLTKSFSSEKYEKDEPFYFAPEYSKMPYVNNLTLLAGLEKREDLKLHSNCRSDAEVEKLQKALPNCKIGHSFL